MIRTSLAFAFAIFAYLTIATMLTAPECFGEINGHMIEACD